MTAAAPKPNIPAPTATAWGRAEDEPCERGTVGCSVDHTASGHDSHCETW
jgi:hypothetical protein